MTIFPPDNLAAWCGGNWTTPPKEPITGFCFDSRKIKKGDLFVALKSEKADGHAFVEKAFAAGAAAAMVDRANAKSRIPDPGCPLLAVDGTLAAFQRIARGWRDAVNPFTVGVTGSVGKSSVKEWTAAILADWRKTASTAANFNNDIGLPASILAMPQDTECAVFEAGVSHPGDMAPLASTMRPDAAIVTCIAPVHIEFFESLAGIADEKAGILRALPESGFAVLDAKGEFFGYLSSQAKCRTVGVCAIHNGETPPAGASYVARIIDEATCRYTIEGPGLDRPEEISLGRPGAHNVLNATLAAAAAKECGAPWSTVLARLRSLPSMALRWERFSADGIDWICDAYNAGPTSMAGSVRAFALAEPPARRTVPRAFVLGDMFELGRDEVEYHKGIAKVLAEIETVPSDILVCVGSLAANYATPDFKGRILHAWDAADAAHILRRELPEGSTVLLKASHGMRLDTVPALYAQPVPELRPSASGAAPQVAVLGAGRSGKAARDLLESQGAEVQMLDGDVPFPDGDIALAVVSPGIPAGHPWLAECRRRGIRAIPELELGFLFWRGRIIAVTGSKGKSSVVKLCADALATSGAPAAPCGNYGTPLSELALAPTPHGWAVAEVSSFQLESVSLFRPEISILLNLQADHLDRHGTMEAYAAAKFNLFRRFRAEDDTAIVERKALDSALALGVEGAKQLAAAPGADSGELAIFGACGAAKTAPGILGSTDDRRQTTDAGLHSGYFANPVLAPAAEAASIALSAAGLPAREISAAFASFEPLPHRMAKVAEANGVVFIDNSKATSLAALAASLEMARKPARLIAGGRIKESDFSCVLPQLEKFAKKVYLIGESSRALFEAWSGTVPCEECGEMRAAAAAAARDAKEGEAVLLAPGCASFDQFGGYAERGRVFAECVKQLSTSTKQKD